MKTIEIGNRIRQAREASGITKSELSKIVGISPSAVTQWENGTTKKFDAENLARAAAAIKTTVEWLLFNGMAAKNIQESESAQGLAAPQDGYVRLRLLDVRPHMGAGAEPVDSPEVLRHVDLLRDYIVMELRANPDKIDLLPATGDSMAGTIESGDVVFVDRTVRRFEGDGIYVIVWSGRLLLKRLQALMDGRIEIKSDNQRYSPEFVNGADEESLAICGRVVGKWGLQRL